MTEQQNTIIHNMREQNFSYLAIARAIGLAGNRKEAFRSNPLKPPVLPSFCRCCGKQITQKEKVKRRISVLMNAV